MSNFFSKVLHGIETVGKFIIDIPAKLPKVIKLYDDAKQDGSTVIPQIAKLVGDVGDIVKVGGQDAAQFLAASKILWPAIVAAAAADGVNITLDVAVLTQIRPLLADGKDFANVIPLFEPLFDDYEALHASVVTDLKQLEADAEAVTAN